MTIFVYILNLSLTPHLMSKVHLRMQKNKELNALKTAAVNFTGGEEVGGEGEVNQLLFKSNFEAISKELMHLSDQMKNANGKAKVFGQNGDDVRNELVSLLEQLRAISEQHFHVDFCVLATRSTFELDLPLRNVINITIVTSIFQHHKWPSLLENPGGKAVE